MYVYAVSRPLASVSHVPLSAIHAAAAQIRTAGAEVDCDTAEVDSDTATAIAETTEQLSRAWSVRRPDIVHAVGHIATLAALNARPDDVPVVATFDERPVPGHVEHTLAREVDAVIALSIAEQDGWRGRGARTFAMGATSIPAPAVDISPASASGDVVCPTTGQDLELIVDSMPLWAPGRLVLLGAVDSRRKALLMRRAKALGVADRIVHVRQADRQRRAGVWAEAALVVATEGASRHAGHVLEAASHGVTAVAMAHDAHEDHLIDGSTGVLVDPTTGAMGLGRAIRRVLADPLRCRGMGQAALLRTHSLNERSVLGHRLLGVYQEVVAAEPAGATRAVLPLTEPGTELVLNYMQLARQLAHRYAGRGQRIEDLVQVANLGLVRAASRFDPNLGSEFHSFAVPTILGELRRHFRDHAWAARVPRSLQEVTLRVQRVTDDLRAQLGHDPSPAEIAEHLGLLEEEVRQALQARGEAMSSKSLDHPMGEDGDEAFGDLVGDLDPRLEHVESVQSIRAALAQLPDREREILLMRFYGEHTQSEIAERLGLSQVHVSRLLTRTLAALRDHVVNEEPLPRAWSEQESNTEVIAA